LSTPNSIFCPTLVFLTIPPFGPFTFTRAFLSPTVITSRNPFSFVIVCLIPSAMSSPFFVTVSNSLVTSFDFNEGLTSEIILRSSPSTCFDIFSKVTVFFPFWIPISSIFTPGSPNCLSTFIFSTDGFLNFKMGFGASFISVFNISFPFLNNFTVPSPLTPTSVTFVMSSPYFITSLYTPFGPISAVPLNIFSVPFFVTFLSSTTINH